MKKLWRAGAIGHTGQGNYGHGLHLAYKGLPDVKMVAIADPDEDGRHSAVKSTGAIVGYADWRDMLENENLDIVSVCPRWVTKHCELVIACAQAGCHIYCEKALACDLAEADRMIDACDAAGVKLAVSHQSRYVEPFLSFREMIRRGDIGRPLAIYGRGKEDHRGGGEDMITLGTHIFDAIRFLVGDPEWVFGHVTVEGRPMTREDAHEGTEPVGLVAGDEIIALFGFANGLRGFFESRQGLSTRGSRMGITIVGTEATLSLRYGKGCTLSRSDSPRVPEEGGNFNAIDTPIEPGVPGAEPLEKNDFISRGNRLAVWDLMQAAEHDRQPISSGRDARWALEMIHGVYASHLASQPLTFPLKERQHPLALEAEEP